MNFDDFMLNESKMTHVDHANKIRARADKWRDKSLKGVDKSDPDHKQVTDAHKHLHKLADHVENKEYTKAFEALNKNKWLSNSVVGSSQFAHIQDNATKKKGE
jgi:hypothetical protein